MMKSIAFASVVLTLPLAAHAEAPVYATPQEALESLMSAMATGSVEETAAVMDPDAGDFLSDPDAPENVAHLLELVELYDEGYRFDPNGPDEVVINLGREDWPMAVPLVRVDGGWVFDVAAGRDEVISRAIGRNELDVIEIMEAYVSVQAAYRLTDHNGDGLHTFAASIISTSEARDGLYWPGNDSPAGDLIARASLDGFDAGEGPQTAEPFRGYYFRILQEQGEAAPGGALSYMINGHMLGGHALLAVPADYGNSGLMSFMVSEAGIVFEKDLGEQSLETGFGITAFNPDEGWQAVSEE